MNLLIDGHNLIGKIPGIDLKDPDDEAKLVSRLRRYAARTNNKLVVFFDGGLPGGASPELSGANIKVIFAPTGQIADPLIINRIRRIRDRSAWTVVSSDQSIQDAAARQRVRIERAEEFSKNLAESLKPSQETFDLPQAPLSEEEIEDWIKIFTSRRKS
ncbi:MAG: NYN domain-containing protein [Anaerolineales bacterium]|nr:NYN domain-containing protein [Anaerolineales bacterium]